MDIEDALRMGRSVAINYVLADKGPRANAMLRDFDWGLATALMNGLTSFRAQRRNSAYDTLCAPSSR